MFFEYWKGALTHTELCKMDIMTRYKYIEELNKFLREKQKQAQKNQYEMDDING